MKSIILKQRDLDFSGISWVCAARKNPKAFGNQILCLVKVEEKRVVATNGHFVLTHDINLSATPGLYEVNKINTKEVILSLAEEDSARYPNVNQVLPAESADKKVLIHRTDTTEGIYTRVLRALPENFTFGFSLFSELIPPNFKETGDVFINYAARNRPKAVVRGKSYWGVLAPVVLEEVGK